MDSILRTLVKEEKRVGEELNLPDNVVESFRIVHPRNADAQATSEYVRKILGRLSAAQGSTIDIDVYIGASKAPNAGVLHHGRTPPAIIITKGLLEAVKTEDELAGVLAHELTHYKIFKKIGEHANGKAEELICDVHSFEMLDAAGYQRDALLNLSRRFKESDKDGNLLRILLDEHPSWENRVRRLSEVKVGMDRTRGDQKSVYGQPISATTIPNEVVSAASQLTRKTIMQATFDAHGYDAMSAVEKMKFLRTFILENKNHYPTSKQVRELRYRFRNIKYDLSNADEIEAASQLADAVFDTHYENDDNCRKRWGEGRKHHHRKRDDYEKYYDELYNATENLRQELEPPPETDKPEWMRSHDRRFVAHPEELYLGTVGELALTQKRFIEAKDEEAALKEAIKLQALWQRFSYKKKYESFESDEKRDLYIGEFFSGDHYKVPWIEFPIPPADKWKEKPDGIMPETSWDPHIQWGKKHRDVAIALHLCGVSGDPRVGAVLDTYNLVDHRRPVEGKESLPEVIKPNDQYHHQCSHFIYHHLNVHKEVVEPKRLDFDEQLEQCLQIQQAALASVDWSLLEKDFNGFVLKYHDALRNPVGSWRDSWDRKFSAPFVEAFLDHVRDGITRGAIPLEPVQAFFHVGDREERREAAAKNQVTLRALMKEQAAKANFGFNDHGARLSGYDPYVQFVYNAPANWFPDSTRYELNREITNVYVDPNTQQRRRGEEDKLPPLRDRMTVTPENFLGKVEDKSLSALLRRFEETPRGLQLAKDETYYLSLVMLVTESLQNQPKPIDSDLLVRVNNFRAVAATIVDHEVTSGLTSQIVKCTQAHTKNLSSHNLDTLIHDYVLFDAAYNVNSHRGNSGSDVIGGYRVSIFDFDADLRSQMEARILELIKKEPDRQIRANALTQLLYRQKEISLKDGGPNNEEVAGKRSCIHQGRLDYLAKVSSPEFRNDVVELMVQELAASLGKDDESQAYMDKLRAASEELLKKLPTNTAFAMLAKLGTSIEAQKATAYYLRDLLFERGLKNVLADPWKGILGEGAAEFLKTYDAEPVRISLLEFIQKPLSDASLSQVMGRLRKHNGTRIFNERKEKGYRSEDDSVAGLELGEMRLEGSYDFMRSRMSTLHREYWSLPIELRTLAMRDMLFPEGITERRYPLYRDYAYHSLFPNSPIPSESVTALIAHCDVSEKDRYKYKPRPSWEGSDNALLRAADPALQVYNNMLDKAKWKLRSAQYNPTWGKAQKGMTQVKRSCVVGVAAAHTLLTQTRLLKQFGQIDLETNETSRDAVNAYIHDLDQTEGEMIIAALMAGKIPSDKKKSIGKTVDQTLRAARAAGDKLRQAASGHPDTPDDIKIELCDSKTKASPPYRWELFEWLEREKLIGDEAVATDKLPAISHVGSMLGSGSYGVAVQVERGRNVSTAITLLRPHVKSQAEREFGIMEQAIGRLTEKRPKLAPVRDMIKQAKVSLATETDMTKAKQQIEIGHQLYDGLTVTVDGEKFTFRVAKLLGVGEGYKETEIVQGKHFNDIARAQNTDKGHLDRLATAIATAETLIRANGGHKDEDRHGGQQRINGNEIGIFDLGGLSLEPMTGKERELLGTVIGEAGKAQFLGRSFSKSVSRSAEKRAMEAPKALNSRSSNDERLFLASLQRSLIAENDYFQHMSSQHQKDMMATVYNSAYVAPETREGMKKGLGIVRQLFDSTIRKATSSISFEASKGLTHYERSIEERSVA